MERVRSPTRIIGFAALDESFFVAEFLIAVEFLGKDSWLTIDCVTTAWLQDD